MQDKDRLKEHKHFTMQIVDPTFMGRGWHRAARFLNAPPP